MRAKDIAIHVVVACSLLIALMCVIAGLNPENVPYLTILMGAVTICLLAGVLFILERMLKRLGK